MGRLQIVEETRTRCWLDLTRFKFMRTGRSIKCCCFWICEKDETFFSFLAINIFNFLIPTDFYGFSLVRIFTMCINTKKIWVTIGNLLNEWSEFCSKKTMKAKAKSRKNDAEPTLKCECEKWEIIISHEDERWRRSRASLISEMMCRRFDLRYVEFIASFFLLQKFLWRALKTIFN